MMGGVMKERDFGLFSAFVGIAGGLELSSTLRRIVQAAVDLTSATYGALGVLGPNGQVTDFINVGMDRATVERLGAPPQGRGILGLLIDYPVAIRLDDLAAHPASVGFPVGHPPMKSFLGVPVRVRGEVFGNLYLAEKRNGEFFTEEDEHLVAALAAAVAVAIENARLYESSRRREEWQQAVADIATTVLSSSDGEQIIPLIAMHARIIAGADACVVAIPDSHGRLIAEVVDEYDPYKIFRSPEPKWAMQRNRPRTLRSAAFTELASSWIGQEIPADSVLQKVMAEGKVVRQVDAVLNIDEPRSFGSVIAIPLMNEDQAIAVFTLIWDIDVQNPNQDALDAVQSFATQAALTLVLAEAQHEHERLALYEDRDRIARDLHDLVIQRLFATGMSLQGASRLGKLDPAVEERISNAVDALDETIRQIRQTIFALHEPTTGPSSGVRGRVLRETEQCAAALGFQPALRFIGPIDSAVSELLGEHMMAVLREGLSNVMKHAQARHIDVTVEVDTAIVRLTVVDDGIGVDIDGLSGKSGVANLYSRAEDLGGSCSLERVQESGGTRLMWCAPLD
jgi:signal transduction histidine kinase